MTLALPLLLGNMSQLGAWMWAPAAIGGLVQFSDVVMLLQRGRRLGDLVGGTAVVRARPSAG